AHAQPAAALDGSPLLFAHPAPDARVLAGFEGPLKAVVDDRTTPANRLGLLNLQQGGAGRSDREEQLRILVPAAGTVTPGHGGNTPRFRGLVAVLAWPLSPTVGCVRSTVRRGGGTTVARN